LQTVVSGVEERVNATAPADPSSPGQGGPWQSTHRRLTVGLLLTMGGVAFESLAVATVMPASAADLGGLALYGWAFSAFLLTNLVGIVVAGGESDRRGPAEPLMVGVSLFAIGLVVGGLAPNMAVLIAGRTLQGFGGGVIGSVAYVAVGRGYPEASRPRMLALLSTAWVVPGLVGPAVAGLIADAVGWRWVFLGLSPIIFVSALLALPSLRRIPGGSATARDPARIRGAIRLAAGSSLFLSGLGRNQLALALPLVVVGLAVALPALRQLLPPGTMVAARGLPAAVAAMGLLNMAFFGVDAFIPLGLVEIRGRSVAFAGLVLTGATITWTVGSWLLARFSATASRRALVGSGLALVALGSAGAAAVILAVLPAVAGPAVWAIAGLGMGLAFSTISLVMLETAPVGGEGRAASSLQLANVLGGGIGTGIGGALIGALGGTAGTLRHAIVGQDAAMIVVACGAILVAGRIPKGPSQRSDAPRS
jgi:MFS family permease